MPPYSGRLTSFDVKTILGNRTSFGGIVLIGSAGGGKHGEQAGEFKRGKKCNPSASC
jgi:hypothetical protein